MASDEVFDKRDSGSDEWPPEYDIPIETLRSWLNRPEDIRRKVHSIVCRKLKCPEVTGRDLVTCEVALKYVLKVLSADILLLEKSGCAALHIFALERKLCGTICGHKFIGYVDRIDSLLDGTVRIVDYKTGSDKQKVLSDSVKPADLFGSKAHDFKAALQFFIYDSLLFQSGHFGSRTLLNSMYAMSDIFSSRVECNPCRQEFAQGVEECLGDLFTRMEDPDLPFTQTGGFNSCHWCDYKTLCGKHSND